MSSAHVPVGAESIMVFNASLFQVKQVSACVYSPITLNIRMK